MTAHRVLSQNGTTEKRVGRALKELNQNGSVEKRVGRARAKLATDTRVSVEKRVGSFGLYETR
jgi:hypothetical protein